jgi:hypothetical protein
MVAVPDRVDRYEPTYQQPLQPLMQTPTTYSYPGATPITPVSAGYSMTAQRRYEYAYPSSASTMVPPSPPGDDAHKLSLPSISKLLEISDGRFPFFLRVRPAHHFNRKTDRPAAGPADPTVPVPAVVGSKLDSRGRRERRLRSRPPARLPLKRRRWPAVSPINAASGAGWPHGGQPVSVNRLVPIDCPGAADVLPRPARHR